MPREFQGFSLIDVIVGIALLLIIFMALFGVLRASLMLSTISKAKAAATELASTQMEYLRGLSYEALGTVGGIPAGNVPQIATSTVDGIPYTTRTYIVYYDDPADGLGAADTDGITTDYKIGKVVVSYAIGGYQNSVTLVSNFAPPGIESTTGGGTLSLQIVNAAGAGLSGATVNIVNTAVSPTVNLTTYSDANGLVLIGGAATSSQYQVYVSRSGYSSAQTYARTSQNINPNPGYLTVATDQTTSATFAIDLLSTLSLSTFSPATTTTFSDTFADSSELATETNTQVSGDALTLASSALSGSAQSISLTPNNLDGWGILSADISAPSGTTATVRVGDATGNPLPDSVLPGNGVGFSTFPVSLTALATSSYPTLTLLADLTSNSTTTAPSILDWSISHTEGPTPLPNTAFTLTGAKTIGTDANNAPIYKTVVNDSTDATGQKTETLEWDAYSLTLPSTSLIESCPDMSYQLAPATATSTALIVGTPPGDTLPILVEGSTNNLIGNAKVVLTTSAYAATIPTSACGLAYFSGLAAGTYTATVSAPGYATTTLSSINVSGQTATTTVILP